MHKDIKRKTFNNIKKTYLITYKILHKEISSNFWNQGF